MQKSTADKGRPRTTRSGDIPCQDPGPSDTTTGRPRRRVLVPPRDVEALLRVDDLVQVSTHRDGLILRPRQVSDPAFPDQRHRIGDVRLVNV